VPEVTSAEHDADQTPVDARHSAGIRQFGFDRFTQAFFAGVFHIEAGDKEPLPLLKLLPRIVDRHLLSRLWVC
jgi:hypothetical protein